MQIIFFSRYMQISTSTLCGFPPLYFSEFPPHVCKNSNIFSFMLMSTLIYLSFAMMDHVLHTAFIVSYTTHGSYRTYRCTTVELQDPHYSFNITCTPCLWYTGVGVWLMPLGPLVFMYVCVVIPGEGVGNTVVLTARAPRPVRTTW